MKPRIIQLTKYLIYLTMGMLFLYVLTGKLVSGHRLDVSSIKHQRLRACEGSKLILIGGSNLSYGINTEMLDNLFDQCVVNMGLQGSIGAEFYFSEIDQNLQEGDIVVLLAEHPAFYKIDQQGEQALYNLCSIRPSLIKYLNFRQICRLPFFVGISIKENIEYFITSIAYKFKGYKTALQQTDRYGDYFGHKGVKNNFEPQKTKLNQTLDTMRIKNFVAFLNQQAKYLESKGVNFFIGHSPVAETASLPKTYKLIEDELSILFPNQIIGSIEDYIFEDDYFFDTEFHLKYEKRDIRTSLFAEQLKEIIADTL